MNVNILVVSDGSSDSQSAFTYATERALVTRGELTVLHVYQLRKSRSEQTLRDSLRCFDLVRASVHDHCCGIPASAVFMPITDHRDILTYATNTQIDLIVAPPAFNALFCSACCLVDIVSVEDLQTAVQ
jgi:hypothetical protein